MENTIPSANIVEIIGNSKLLDYAEFTGQYGPCTLYDLEYLSHACELTGMDSMIYRPRIENLHCLTYIKAGFTAMLFADCYTTEYVRKCVQFVKLIPHGGINGIQLGRVIGYGTVRDQQTTFTDYVKYIVKIVIAIMIETKTLADDIEEAFFIPGIDMAPFGHGNSSISISSLDEECENS